jgi:hypothetical protein
VGERRRARGGRQAGHVEDVLDTERHAVQRPAQTAGARLGVALAGGGQRAVAVDVRPGLQLRLQCAHAGQARLDERHRRAGAAADAVGGLDHAEIGQGFSGRHRAPRRQPRSGRRRA